MENPNKSDVHVIDVPSASSSNDDDQQPPPPPPPPPSVEVPQQQQAQHQNSRRLPNRFVCIISRILSEFMSPPGSRSPLTLLRIYGQLVVTLSQIIAAIVVLSLSANNEKPQSGSPLFTWIVGYASGRVATLPTLYWKFRKPRVSRPLRQRINRLVNHYNMGTSSVYWVWFVVGNVWIFGGHSSPSDAPKLYRLSIVFLTFMYINLAMAMIVVLCNCCLPCIIYVLGVRVSRSHQIRGATTESINGLPAYKYKQNRNGTIDDHQNNTTGEGGLLAAGTDKERAISKEDAVCGICLANYLDGDELRELTCLHVFHLECVDKWLKIRASCPVCLSKVRDSSGSSTGRDSGQH